MPEPLVFTFLLLPPRECSPNSRAHWAARKRAVDEWKLVARTNLHYQLPYGYPLPLKPPVRASTVISIPKRKWRRFDLDNWGARLKPVFDLLVAEGILEDDRAESFKPFPPVLEKGEAEGLVVVLASGEEETP